MPSAVFVLILIALVLGALSGNVVKDSLAYASSSTQVVTICDKESVLTDDGSEYRVYTSGGTYKVTDYRAAQGWRTDSADFYGGLQVGKTYKVTAIGWRVPWFSWFENITEATSTGEKPTGTC